MFIMDQYNKNIHFLINIYFFMIHKAQQHSAHDKSSFNYYYGKDLPNYH